MDPPHIQIRDGRDGLTALEITATDRPGLLSAIAETLVGLGLRLFDARVATFGQRVEDVFMIAQSEGDSLERLDDTTQAALYDELMQCLKGEDGADE
jgi:[protein-PII] uridylyltransferase